MIVLHYVLLVYSTITTGEQKKWGHQLGNSHILNYFLVVVAFFLVICCGIKSDDWYGNLKKSKEECGQCSFG